MRFDTPVYFQKIKEGAYSPESGDYLEDTVEEVCVYADVTDAGTDTLKIMYNSIAQSAKVIRLQNRYDKPHDCIRIGDKRYKVDAIRNLRKMQIMIISEVQ